jgi:hypothetical protein
VNVQLLGGLSLQTGLLYDRIGQRSDNYTLLYPENSITFLFATTHGSAWEVPILAKYRFRSGRSGWRPFLAAGPTVRRTSVRTDNAATILAGTSLSPIGGPAALHATNTQWNVDPAVGAGVDFRAGRFHLEPEMRYSYWAAGKNGPLRKNQVNFLLGFRF